MCRLLGFATAGSNTNLNGVLGMQNVRDFRNLSEIHNDGWGAALITVPDESPYRRDGGAPTPETGTAIYKTPSPPVMIRFRRARQHSGPRRPVAPALGQLQPAADS